MRGILGRHVAAARACIAMCAETAAGDAGAVLVAAHQAPHTRSEWEAELVPLRLEAAAEAHQTREALRRAAAVVAEECEWLRVDWRRWAAAGDCLEVCMVREMQAEVGEEEQGHGVLYSWSP